MDEAEKEAERIIEMFLNVKSNKMNDHSRIEYPTAKQCAIIHVEGMSNFIDEQYNGYYTMPEKVQKQIDFWQQVKQAIEKA